MVNMYPHKKRKRHMLTHLSRAWPYAEWWAPAVSTGAFVLPDLVLLLVVPIELLHGIQQCQGVIPKQHCSVLRVEPHGGLPTHCVGIGHALTLITDTDGLIRGKLYTLHVLWPSVIANGYEVVEVQTIGTHRY